jgi:uncharacterized integral membrane protein (TIGR00698 family)
VPEDPAITDHLKPLRDMVFLGGCIFALTPWASAPVSLGLGVALALLGLAAFQKQAKKWSKLLIQVCIVLLGFSMNLSEVVRAGATGLLFAAGTIVGTFAAGYLLGRLLRTDRTLTTLLSTGTAICGGSAIAAVGAVIGASEVHMSVSLATVFILNACGLYIFPPLGHALHLSDVQFGTWAAVAIHDVSSVVGAASFFGEHYSQGSKVALQTATAVKLSRTLWIVPVAFVAAWAVRRGAAEPGAPVRKAAPVPWFIGLFVLAAASRTWAPLPEQTTAGLVVAAKTGMSLALYLIGSGLSRKAIAAVGWRPLALGVGLWVLISGAALFVVWRTV